MCHGLIDQRATIIVPDLLRNQCYQIADYEKKEEVYPSEYGSGSVDLALFEEFSMLPESAELSEDALAELVNDYSSAVKKFDAEEVAGADALASTGSLSTWFDCIKEDFCSGAGKVTKAPLVDVKKDQLAEDVTPEPVNKGRKARKSTVKEQSHAQHDSEMDDGAPVLIDEKRKRRMSSNRASAQRSRQRKQERLDELEILTAQLRLENATLSRRSKMAEQLAKRVTLDKNELAKKVEELKKQLEVARQALSHSSSDSGDDSNTSANHDSGVCDMDEGGETSAFEVEAVPKGINKPKSVGTTTVDTRKRNLSTADEVSHGIFQDLYDVIESDQLDVCLGAEVTELLQEEWYGSFTECLNAA